MAALMVGPYDHSLAYRYNQHTCLWESTGQKLVDYYAAELSAALDAMQAKSQAGANLPPATAAQRREQLQDLADALPVESVGGLMGRVAYQGGVHGGLFLELEEELKPRIRLASDLMCEEMHATYFPEAKTSRVASMLFGPRKNRTRADAERNFVTTLAFEGCAYLGGPGGAKLLALMRDICGHTRAFKRYVRPSFCMEPGADNSAYWDATNARVDNTFVCDFDAAKLDKHTLFTWICQQSAQYAY
jgi:hypothetical protein